MPEAERVVAAAPGLLAAGEFLVGEQRAGERVDDVARVRLVRQYDELLLPVTELLVPSQGRTRPAVRDRRRPMPPRP